MQACGEIQGNEQIAAAAFLGHPLKNGGFRRTRGRHRAQSKQPVDDEAGPAGLEKSFRLGRPDQRLFPDLGFDARIRMDPFSRSPGEEQFRLPAEFLEFQSQENRVITIMAGADEEQGMSGCRKERENFAQRTCHRLPHQILHPPAFAKAFFLPGTGLRRGKNDHEPRRATVAAEWLRV